jgi:hypothetical protein
MTTECQPCRAKQQIISNQNIPNIILPNQTSSCNTTLSFLRYLINLIDLNISDRRMTDEDRFQLQVFKGQIQSGINIQNYCYIDYNIVEINIVNVLSKYQ